jgi:hypothetical protein
MDYQNLVNSTDPNMVVDGMNIIKANYLANGEFLPNTNPLKIDSYNSIRNHFSNSSFLLSPDDLKSYLATSVITHCFDGWLYLSHAIDSLLKGDRGIAIHLAYYSELRGTLSFLARQGVSVNNRNNMGINNSGILNSSGSGGTHVATWKYLESWINSSSSHHISLLKYFVVRNKNLEEWINFYPTSITPAVASQYALSWMKEWSFDIQNYERDHIFRDTVTYQPQRLRDNSFINFKTKFSAVSNIWKFLEPSGSDKFALLDKYLLSKLFKNIYDNNTLGGSGRSLIDITNKTFTNAGLSMDLSIKTIINTGTNNQLLQNAKDPAIDSTNGELKPLHIISRALLMLRIASGCTRELLNSAGITNANIDFYLNNLGNNNGHWKGATPNNFEVLWEDISDSIDFIDELIAEPDDINLVDLYSAFAKELHHFKQISRACFWGSCA